MVAFFVSGICLVVGIALIVIGAIQTTKLGVKSLWWILGGFILIFAISPGFFSLVDTIELAEEFPDSREAIVIVSNILHFLRYFGPVFWLVGGALLLYDAYLAYAADSQSAFSADADPHTDEAGMATFIGIGMILVAAIWGYGLLPHSLSPELKLIRTYLKEEPSQGVSVSLNPFSVSMNYKQWQEGKGQLVRELETKLAAVPQIDISKITRITYYSVDSKTISGIMIEFEDGTSHRINETLNTEEVAILLQEIKIAFVVMSRSKAVSTK